MLTTATPHSFKYPSLNESPGFSLQRKAPVSGSCSICPPCCNRTTEPRRVLLPGNLVKLEDSIQRVLFVMAHQDRAVDRDRPATTTASQAKVGQPRQLTAVFRSTGKFCASPWGSPIRFHVVGKTRTDSIIVLRRPCRRHG